MSSPENEDALQTSDSVSIHESFLPEWQGDEVACELCGDAGGAASLMICENLDKGCECGCSSTNPTSEITVLLTPLSSACACMQYTCTISAR